MLFSQLHISLLEAMEKTTFENASWQRLQAVIEHSRIQSVSAFTRHIGINKPENLYQIRRGNNGISKELAKTICGCFPEISMGWLLTGEGSMILGEERQKEERQERAPDLIIKVIIESV